MVVNITFLSFLLFSMCKSIHDAVNTWINCSFFILITVKVGLLLKTTAKLFATPVALPLFFLYYSFCLCSDEICHH